MKNQSTQATDSEPLTMMRVGKNLAEMDRSFDLEYWQRQGDAAIFAAAWEMVEFYLRDKGAPPDEYRLQRSIESFQRTRS